MRPSKDLSLNWYVPSTLFVTLIKTLTLSLMVTLALTGQWRRMWHVTPKIENFRILSKVWTYTVVVWYFLTLILDFVLGRWRSVNVYPLVCYWWATTDFPPSSAETLSVRSKSDVYQTQWSMYSEVTRFNTLLTTALAFWKTGCLIFPKIWIFC